MTTAALTAASWFLNIGGFSGGIAAVLIGIPAITLLVARRSLQRRPEPGLWIATLTVVALIAAAVVAARTVPGHSQLEARLDELPGLERVGSFERSGRSTCLPDCATISVRYRFSTTPDVAMATAVAVLTHAGFELEGGAAEAFTADAMQLHDDRVRASVDARQTEEGSTVFVTLQGRR